MVRTSTQYNSARGGSQREQGMHLMDEESIACIRVHDVYPLVFKLLHRQTLRQALLQYSRYLRR